MDVLLRLALTPGWTDLLSLTVERAARVFSLMAERGLELQAAELLAQQDMADPAEQVRVTGWSRGEVGSA